MPLPEIQNPNMGPFERFYRQWLVGLESLRSQLHEANQRPRNGSQADERRMNELVIRILWHYSDYYRVKQTLVRDDVLILFGPPWLTHFERTLLWIGGFKPGFAFRVLADHVTDLSEEQRLEAGLLAAETAAEEMALTAQFATVHARPTATWLVEMANGRRERMNGETESSDEGVQMVKAAMGVLVECADFVRCKTVLSIVEILNCSQRLKFMLTLADIQLLIRNRGLDREADQNNPASADNATASNSGQ